MATMTGRPDAFSVTDRRVVVVGAGRSGLAAAELLAARGADVVISEVRSDVTLPRSLTTARVRLDAGGHLERALDGADLVVVSPGVAARHPFIVAARRRAIPVIGEIELASRWLRGRLVAVTGTKGKSTTVSLASQMLEQSGVRALAGGNIGVPLSTQVEASADGVVHVVEVSSFQLDTIESFHPWVAVLLNVASDHLDWHGTAEAYAAAKARIFENQAPSDWAVVNADDAAAMAVAGGARARRLAFACDTSLAEGVVVSNDTIVHRTRAGDSPLIPLSAVRLRGAHLLSDVLAASAIGVLAGATPRGMTLAVESFRGLEHALEDAGEIDGIRFIDDSKATNVLAACRGLESFERPVVAILGGRHKGGDLRPLRAALEGRARAVVLIGEAREALRTALVDTVPLHDADSLLQAVRMAHGLAPPGGTVVFAPACASFDMFRDYAERGRAFKGEVAALARERQMAREQ